MTAPNNQSSQSVRNRKIVGMAQRPLTIEVSVHMGESANL